MRVAWRAGVAMLYASMCSVGIVGVGCSRMSMSSASIASESSFRGLSIGAHGEYKERAELETCIDAGEDRAAAESILKVLCRKTWDGLANKWVAISGTFIVLIVCVLVLVISMAQANAIHHANMLKVCYALARDAYGTCIDAKTTELIALVRYGHKTFKFVCGDFADVLDLENPEVENNITTTLKIVSTDDLNNVISNIVKSSSKWSIDWVLRLFVLFKQNYPKTFEDSITGLYHRYGHRVR